MRTSKRMWLVLSALTAGSALAAQGNPAGAPAGWPAPVMDQARYGGLFVDRLERGDGPDGDNLLWDVKGWLGGDYQKLWVRTEGEGAAGKSPDVAEFQLLYDRTIAPFWDVQAGARYDVRRHGEETAYAVVGVQGLAPQWFETNTAAFLSQDGDLSLRSEMEYDVLMTQRLVLQPRVEFNLSATDVPELGVGRGLSTSEIGMRLRYEIKRELAPYVGVRWERLYGGTAERARAAGAPVSRAWFVMGVRAWF